MYYIFLSDVTIMTFLGAIALAPRTRILSHVHALAQELVARAGLSCASLGHEFPAQKGKEPCGGVAVIAMQLQPC